jgi:cytochrome c556
LPPPGIADHHPGSGWRSDAADATFDAHREGGRVMKRLKRCKGFLAVVLLAGAAGLGVGHAADPVAPVPAPPLPPKPPFADPQEAIVARKEAMKTDGKMFKAIKAALAADQDVRPFAEDAQWFAGWAKQIPLMFPPGSETGHDTKAKPSIWTDKAGFDKFAADMAAAAEPLAQAAQSGDKAAFASAFQTLGKSCGGCHKAYAYPLQ